MTHTSGPWEINNDELLSTHGVYGDGFFVAEVMLAEDANLIAAAPELLEAVQYALDVSTEGLLLGEEWQARAQAAIAKAKGKS